MLSLESPITIFFAVVVLLVSSWPLTVLLTKRPYWASFPAIIIGLALCTALYVAGVVSLAVLAPRMTILLAVVAAVGGAMFWWRARPTFGHRRKLPPGSLALAPADMFLDPAFFEKQNKMYGPIFKASHFLHPMVCIVSFDTGFEVLRQYEDTALRAPEAPFARYIKCSYLRSMSVEDHDKYRPILQAAVSSEVTDACAPEVSAALIRGLERMAKDSKQDDLGRPLENYAEEALYEVLFRVFFGIVPGSQECKEFRELYRTLDRAHRRQATRVWSPSDRIVDQALREIYTRLNQRIKSFAQTPSIVPESYLEAAWRHGGLPAVNETVQGNMIFLLQVSRVDLTGLFQWILKKLSDHPEWQMRLRGVIQQHGKDSVPATDLAERIVSETFRLEQSEHIYRKVLQPIQIKNFHIPKGWLLRICVRESHHCSPVFEDPESFNPDRFLGRTYGPTEYAPFGLYRKRCIGVHTLKRIGGIFVKELVHGYEWRVTDGGIQDFRGWHWTPGSTFAVSLNQSSVPHP